MPHLLRCVKHPAQYWWQSDFQRLQAAILIAVCVPTKITFIDPPHLVNEHSRTYGPFSSIRESADSVGRITQHCTLIDPHFNAFWLITYYPLFPFEVSRSWNTIMRRGRVCMSTPDSQCRFRTKLIERATDSLLIHRGNEYLLQYNDICSLSVIV